VQPRVRDLETRLVDRLVAVEKQVEIDRARPVTGPLAPDAAELAFDPQEERKQLTRGPRRRHACGSIEKARLIDVADRLCLDRSRRAQNGGAFVLVHAHESFGDRRFALA